MKVKQTEQIILGYIDFNKYNFYINYITQGADLVFNRYGAL